AVLASEARHPSIEQVKNAGQDDQQKGLADGGTEGAGIGDVRSDDERQRQEAAKKISGRQQVRQQIYFQLRNRAFARRSVTGLQVHRSLTFSRRSPSRRRALYRRSGRGFVWRA